MMAHLDRLKARIQIMLTFFYTVIAMEEDRTGGRKLSLKQSKNNACYLQPMKPNDADCFFFHACGIISTLWASILMG